ncbi:MAG: 2-oxo acid dehydrogenase subunit E2 [Myxococcota bacterium]
MLPALFRRPDGTPLHDKLSISRRFLPFMLGDATSAWLLWEEQIRIQPALDFIDAWNARYSTQPELRISLHHLTLRAIAMAIHHFPRLNKFLAGDRYYQRNELYISYSAKKKHAAGAGLLIFKRAFPRHEPMEELVRSLNSRVKDDRKVEKSAQEKELQTYLRFLPRSVIRLAMRGIDWLDSHNLLPKSFISHHALFSGIFVSNLASLGLESGWHHLYRQGQISLFGVLGRPRDQVVAEAGQPVVRKVCSLKWTFDERIEDGYNAGRAATFVTRLMENPRLLVETEAIATHPAFAYHFDGHRKVDDPPLPEDF